MDFHQSNYKLNARECASQCRDGHHRPNFCAAFKTIPRSGACFPCMRQAMPICRISRPRRPGQKMNPTQSAQIPDAFLQPQPLATTKSCCNSLPGIWPSPRHDRRGRRWPSGRAGWPRRRWPGLSGFELALAHRSLPPSSASKPQSAREYAIAGQGRAKPQTDTWTCDSCRGVTEPPLAAYPATTLPGT